MTAVEWLIEQIKNDQNQKALSSKEWIEVLEQAKEMEKQQIIDAYNNGDLRSADLYYDKTYGSKGSDGLGQSLEWNGEVTQGSDDQVPDVRKMVEWIDKEILLNPHYANSPRLREGANMVKVKLQQYTPTSSQTEISDEEITKLANKYILYNDSKRQWVIEGMKLYREQFKQK